MKNIIFSLVLTFVSSGAFALDCLCTQTFYDHLDNSFEMTLYVDCPKTQVEAHLSCSSSFQNRTFTVKCADKATNEFNDYSYKFNSWTKQDSGYAFCRLESSN